MKAYGIYEGCIYEGGGVDGDLYLDIEKARLFLVQEVEKQNAERLPQFRFRKVDDDRYLAGADVLKIQEFTIHQ